MCAIYSTAVYVILFFASVMRIVSQREVVTSTKTTRIVYRDQK